MKKKNWAFVLFSLMFLTIMTGCQHDPMVNTISNAVQTANVQRVVDQRVITDAVLAKTLYLVEVRESKTNDGFKRIQIFLKNLSSAPFAFSYRFNWYDGNGVEVEAQDDEMWKQFRAVPGDDVTLTSVAPKKNCGDFKLRIVSMY